MQNRELEAIDLFEDIGCCEPVRGGVDQLAVGNERRGLREPGRIPERADFASRLVAGACASVEAVIGGRLKEERAQWTLRGSWVGNERAVRLQFVGNERAVRLQLIALVAPYDRSAEETGD